MNNSAAFWLAAWFILCPFLAYVILEYRQAFTGGKSEMLFMAMLGPIGVAWALFQKPVPMPTSDSPKKE